MEYKFAIDIIYSGATMLIKDLLTVKQFMELL